MSNTVYSLSVIIPTTRRQGVTASSLQKRKLRLREGNWLALCNLKELSGNLGLIQGRKVLHPMHHNQITRCSEVWARRAQPRGPGLTLWKDAVQTTAVSGTFFYEAKSYIGKGTGLEQWGETSCWSCSPFLAPSSQVRVSNIQELHWCLRRNGDVVLDQSCTLWPPSFLLLFL